MSVPPAASLGSAAARHLGRAARTGARRAALRAAPGLGTVVGVDTHQPVFALTFDDGPDPRFTPALLEVLDRWRARATFFVLGAQVDRHPELVSSVSAAGHTVASHGWGHTSMLQLSGNPAAIEAELHRAAQAIGSCPRLFRPPYGHLDLNARRALRRAGQTIIGWDVDPRDWQSLTPPEIADRIEAQVRPGSIVLLHDRLEDADDPNAFDRRATVAAVDVLLGRLEGRLQSVTVPELLMVGRPRRQLVTSSPTTAPRLRNPDVPTDADGDAQTR